MAAIINSQRLLKTFQERGVIIGGIAVIFLGKPRFTADLDAVFLLSINDIPQLIDRARAVWVFFPLKKR